MGVKNKNVYLLSLLRQRLEYPALKRAVREQQNLYHATEILIEDKASGTLKATQIVLAMLQDVEARADDSSDSAAFTEADQEIIQRIQARLRNETDERR